MIKKIPKVLVGSPVSDMHEYCFDEFVSSRKRLTYPNHDLFFVDNSQGDHFFKRVQESGLPITRIPWEEKARLRMVNSRNLLRQKVLDEDYDYFLNLDQDIIPPDDIVEMLVRHNKDIVTGVYFNPLHTRNSNKLIDSNKLIRSVVGVLVNDKIRYLSNEELMKPRLVKINVCGTGCILISRRVFEKIKFRYDTEGLSFDDAYLVYDAYENGFEVYADTGAKCRHLIVEKPWHWGELLDKKTL